VLTELLCCHVRCHRLTKCLESADVVKGVVGCSFLFSSKIYSSEVYRIPRNISSSDLNFEIRNDIEYLCNWKEFGTDLLVHSALGNISLCSIMIAPRPELSSDMTKAEIERTPHSFETYNR
jgi:hypothetical protein